MIALKVFAFLFVAVTLKNVAEAKRICAGCPEEQDPSNDECKNMLKGILEEQNFDLSNKNTKIVKCTSQVVSGAKWDIVFDVQNTNTRQHQLCHASFISQPWLNENNPLKYPGASVECKPSTLME